ncbi:DUF1345 domain-containing protein [Cellulomonas pakistanensis]|uniref:DUF1345 domain-containing protein n=1 Tax=Cellulomonas pakistanensis TaxID=992287 RepID=A0A919P8J9_9CELL|nr:DUF1345 domain-containing protein [Cellulomonas pakistanensis]GIG35088.1 hypothetical protein Cpa01nite_04690 [Cellulomonas pakistanensis]
MASRYVSDNVRANWSFAAALVVAVGVVALRSGELRLGPAVAASLYLVMWPVFTLLYLVWTHVTYAGRGPRGLVASAWREQDLGRRWWNRVLGYGGAASWTLSAAVVAVAVTIFIAQDPTYRDDWTYIGLGLLNVACSWAQMVYAFALQYLRLDAGRRDDGERHLTVDVEGTPQFGDYLTLAVLLSAMAATVSGHMRSRAAWTLARTHVLLAFSFNSVVVAMMVSLLFGGLGS